LSLCLTLALNLIEDSPSRVEQLLGSKKLGEMGKVAKSLGRASAAPAICGKCCRVRWFQIRRSDEDAGEFCGGFILILLKPKSLQQAKFSAPFFPIQSPFLFTLSIGFDHLRRFYLPNTGQ
jgi:hypothetical protein